MGEIVDLETYRRRRKRRAGKGREARRSDTGVHREGPAPAAARPAERGGRGPGPAESPERDGKNAD